MAVDGSLNGLKWEFGAVLLEMRPMPKLPPQL